MSGGASATTIAAVVAAAASVAAGAVSAVGSMQQADAASKAASYNSQLAAENAQIANNNATQAAASGEAQAEQQALKTRAEVGNIKANQSASGIDINSGSSVDVRSSAQELGELNALTVRSNAAKQAYGYETQAASETGQSQLDKMQASSASAAGSINAGSSVLGGVGGAASNYANFLKVGGGGSTLGVAPTSDSAFGDAYP